MKELYEEEKKIILPDVARKNSVTVKPKIGF
jgi:hypothetical protein